MPIFYDYIRSAKLHTIRYVKNISMFVAATLLTVAIVLIAVTSSKQQSIKPLQQPKANTSDSKMNIEKAKQNSIMGRFVSYVEVQPFYKSFLTL